NEARPDRFMRPATDAPCRGHSLASPLLCPSPAGNRRAKKASFRAAPAKPSLNDQVVACCQGQKRTPPTGLWQEPGHSETQANLRERYAPLVIFSACSNPKFRKRSGGFAQAVRMISETAVKSSAWPCSKGVRRSG